MTNTKQEVYVVHVCLTDDDIFRSFSTKKDALIYIQDYVMEVSPVIGWNKCPATSSTGIQGMWHDGDMGYIYLEKTILNET